MKKIFSLIVLVIGLSLLLTACGGGAASAPATEIKVTMTDFVFEPMAFTIAAGKEITLTATNNGAVEHEFVIIKKGMEVTQPFDDDDEDKVYWEVEVPAGESISVTFTAPAEAGDYTLVCGIPGHLEAGMTGTVTVK